MSKDQDGMDVFVLLDRTGSMAPLWVEAVSSVNTYVRELEKDGAGDRVTVAAFDAYESEMQFDILRDAISITEWNDIGKDEVFPRGTTPLLDALVKLVARAEEAGNDKTAIVVMTDGYENASREVTLEAAKATLDRIQQKNWQVSFLGANFDGIAQAGRLGVDHGRSMNFSQGHADAAMSSTARQHSRYRHSQNAVFYLDEDRTEAGEDQVR